jgi:hypothetical protein
MIAMTRPEYKARLGNVSSSASIQVAVSEPEYVMELSLLELVEPDETGGAGLGTLQLEFDLRMVGWSGPCWRWTRRGVVRCRYEGSSNGGKQ